MDGRKIMLGLILLLIVCVTCASIYASETGAASHTESSNDHAGLHISGLNNVSNMMGSVSPINNGIPNTVSSVYL